VESVSWKLLAALCAGLFAGAAIYVNLVEHPARMQAGVQVALAEFGPSYHRATVMQASLALVGATAALIAWFRAGGWLFLVGGAALGAVVPFTLAVILPTNRRLLSSGLDVSSPETIELLAHWARLHAVRSGLGLLAFVLLLVALCRR